MLIKAATIDKDRFKIRKVWDKRPLFVNIFKVQDLIDVYDQDEKPTGRIATYSEVRDEGLYRQGVHVIVYSPTGRIVMQKRSDKLDFHPSKIEVSVGGGVVAGESPIQAAIREVYEEVGINAVENDLVFIGKRKFNHKYVSDGQITYKRSFDYFYRLKVDEATLENLKSFDGEASLLFTITKRQLIWALRKRYLKGYGHFMPFYSYWVLMVKSI